MSQVFGATPIIVSLLIGLAGAALALVVRLAKGDGSKALLRALETLLTGALGAFLAHAFIASMLVLGEHSNEAVTLTSFFFFIWPGLVSGAVHLATGGPLIGEAGVLWIALIVGGGVGIMDGLWATHRWLGFGVISFLLEVTWGLSGSTNGLLLHLINFAWAEHADGTKETRRSAHRYDSGFALKPGFGFTQGAVMSNMSGHPPDTPLHNHEMIHVWQNRLLGPFFWFSYMGWMVLTFIPALITGLIARRVGDVILWWTYYNNPWEVMAYGIANPTSRDNGRYPKWMCWPWVVAILLGMLLASLIGATFVWLFSLAYL